MELIHKLSRELKLVSIGEIRVQFIISQELLAGLLLDFQINPSSK